MAYKENVGTYSLLKNQQKNNPSRILLYGSDSYSEHAYKSVIHLLADKQKLFKELAVLKQYARA